MIYSYVFLPPYITISQIFETASSSSLKDFMSPKLFGKVASRIQADSGKKKEEDDEQEDSEEKKNEKEREEKPKEDSEAGKKNEKEREEKPKDNDGARPVEIGKLRRNLFKTGELDRTKHLNPNTTSSTSSSASDFWTQDPKLKK